MLVRVRELFYRVPISIPTLLKIMILLKLRSSLKNSVNLKLKSAKPLLRHNTHDNNNNFLGNSTSSRRQLTRLTSNLMFRIVTLQPTVDCNNSCILGYH